ncbi:hypothetical protein KL86PLE_130247 [uncultured Pleomorphomonas sp.]|uniref:Uncharacterized protein n=1 Tax=uncultured Pleomorphomonas sp. TaxID=442121 RepID=A0A212LB11_9HYPH|nr:hypothetical protein KL86PLE_130247 [uncultured Pleomorphomonas sp.]
MKLQKSLGKYRLALAQPAEAHYKRPSLGGLRLSVRTLAFHAGETGSIPVGRTILPNILFRYPCRSDVRFDER